MDHEVEVEELGSDIEEDQQVQRNPMDPGVLLTKLLLGGLFQHGHRRQNH